MLKQKNKIGLKLSLWMQIIAFSSLFLVALPWLGYRYMDDMKEFLVTGQGEAQLLAARAIATVLHNRSDLFNVSRLPTNSLVDESSLYVYQLDTQKVIDGYGSDWGTLLSQRRAFGPESLVYDRTAGAIAPATFELLLGEHGEHLFGFISVEDRHVVHRHPRYARLDRSDQVRLELVNSDGIIKRYALLSEVPGNVSVYEMHESWIRPITGKPIYKLNAIWRDTPNGYDVEFRLPLEWLNSKQQLLISAADVNSDVERNIDNIVATLADSSSSYLNQLIIRSPELDRIFSGLGYADSNVCIVDQFRRVRALLGSNATQSELCSSTDKVAPDLVAKALQGESEVYRSKLTTQESLVIASHPIYQDSEIIGAVLVEKNSSNILAQQSEALNKIIFASIILFIIAVAGLLLFSSLLAYRIRNLQREVSTAIDPNGRLIKESISASQHAGDEVGELSRGVSSLLSQLNSYTGFLESVPRTLRHEILNPLNTISMSLQKMGSEHQYDQKTVDGANSALRQLELIVHSLTEAAHIDDALSQDEKERFDLAELLSEYLTNIQNKHLDNSFKYIGPESGITIQGSDLRITQLLDKLKDNAIDFSDAGSYITFELSVTSNQVILNICNNGPLIPYNVIDHLTHGILSHRHVSVGEPHLGIGLYVASRIAIYHHGSLDISNRESGDGVCVTITLPLAEEI